jgi:hypothetical protein
MRRIFATRDTASGSLGMRAGAAIAVVAATAFFVPAAQAKPRTCFPHGTKTVVANAKVRVFLRAPKDSSRDTKYYACLLRSGKRTPLGASGGDQIGSYYPHALRLRGPLLGWAYRVSGAKAFSCRESARSVDLRTGRTIASFDDESRTACVEITALQMARSGALGLIDSATRYDQPAPVARSVRSVTAEGVTLLDSGEDIEATSLAVGGGRLYWTRGGEPRSAPLH